MERLEQIYGELNDSLFGGRLPKVSFEKEPSRKSILHAVPPDVIQIGNQMVSATPRQVIDDLIHVMVHLKNHMEGTLDYTSNQYHNTSFLQGALDVGLCVVWHKSRGWALTYSDPKDAEQQGKYRCPEPEAQARLKEALGKVRLRVKDLRGLQNELSDELSGKEKKTYLMKYVCKCSPPHNAIRSGRRPDGPHPLNITCNNCSAKFVPAKG